MERPVVEPQGARGPAECLDNLALNFRLQPRRCDVDRLFEKRARQRFRLVEYREDSKLPSFHQPFNGDLVSLDVRFSLDKIARVFPHDPDLRAAQQLLDPPERPDELVGVVSSNHAAAGGEGKRLQYARDRKSTRLNSSHLVISYAVFCLKKKKKRITVISQLGLMKL